MIIVNTALSILTNQRSGDNCQFPVLVFIPPPGSLALQAVLVGSVMPLFVFLSGVMLSCL